MAQVSKRLRKERRTRRELSLTRRTLQQAYTQLDLLGNMLVEERKKVLEEERSVLRTPLVEPVHGD